MKSFLESVLTALVLTFTAHLLLVAARTPADAALETMGTEPAAVDPSLGADAPDPMRAELLRAMRRDLARLGVHDVAATNLAGSSPAQPPSPERQRTDALGLGQYWNWLAQLPGEMVSLHEAGAVRRFLRTLLAFAVAAIVWLSGSMLGLFASARRLSPERVLTLGTLLLASSLPVFCLANLGYGSTLLAGVGAGMLGGLLPDGFLGVRALTRPLPGYVQAAYGHGHRWLLAEGHSAEPDPEAPAPERAKVSVWRRWITTLELSLDYQLLRPRVSELLFLLRSRLPLLLGAVIVAELALDLEGLGRTFNSFDQKAAHGSFLTGVLLCFGLIRLFSWGVRRLEARFDPLLAHRPSWTSARTDPLEHQARFSLIRRGEWRWVLVGALMVVPLIAGEGWLTASLIPPVLCLNPVRRWLGSLGWIGLIGVALCTPLLVLMLVPPAWLDPSPVLGALAGTGRKALIATLAVLLALRSILKAELRGGGLRRGVEVLGYGLESLPQVLTAVVLLRLAFAALDRLSLDSPWMEESIAGLIYGLFGIAFVLRAIVEPLGSARQRRHVRCSRALGISDHEVLTELLGGRMRRTLGAVAALIASMAILLDAYVGFVLERTLTTGGGYSTALGQLFSRNELGAGRLLALGATVVTLAGLQLIRGAFEEPAS